MKIPLHMRDDSAQSSKAAQARVLDRDLAAAKKGDWTAKNNLVRSFMPLLTSLAEKRSHEPAKMNKYIEAGKNGLFAAARKYKPSIGADKFQIYALDFIEEAMNRVGAGGAESRGFFARLFGR